MQGNYTSMKNIRNSPPQQNQYGFNNGALQMSGGMPTQNLHLSYTSTKSESVVADEFDVFKSNIPE